MAGTNPAMTGVSHASGGPLIRRPAPLALTAKARHSLIALRSALPGSRKMTSAQSSHSLSIRLAPGIAGYCTFINLYSPQAILPLLSQEFGASAAALSTIITVSTLDVALT